MLVEAASASATATAVGLAGCHDQSLNVEWETAQLETAQLEPSLHGDTPVQCAEPLLASGDQCTMGGRSTRCPIPLSHPEQLFDGQNAVASRSCSHEQN